MDKKRRRTPTLVTTPCRQPDLYGGPLGSRGLDMDDIDNMDNISYFYTRKFLFLISQHHQNGANSDVQRD